VNGKKHDRQCHPERQRTWALAEDFGSEIQARGDTPFLHVRDDNTSAIAPDERPGFKARKTFSLYRASHDA
jgi:predicted GNAT family acetyltransferase